MFVFAFSRSSNQRGDFGERRKVTELFTQFTSKRLGITGLRKASRRWVFGTQDRWNFRSDVWPFRVSLQDSEDEISHLEWETVRVRFVKAATLEKLVESLATDDGELESTYINVFLATYRTFATPKQVLQLFLKRFRQLSDGDEDHMTQQHKKYVVFTSFNFDLTTDYFSPYRTLVLALHVWLDSYPEDFREPLTHPALHELLDFTQKYLPGSELEVKVKHRLDRFVRDDQCLGMVYIKY